MLYLPIRLSVWPADFRTHPLKSHLAWEKLRRDQYFTESKCIGQMLIRMSFVQICLVRYC